MKKLLIAVLVSVVTLTGLSNVKIAAAAQNETNAFAWHEESKNESGYQQNGFAQAQDGNWYLYSDGNVNTSYTGLCYDAYYGWWLVLNGRVAHEYTGLYNDANCGWWLVVNGMVAFDYNGLYNDANCGWWLISGGAVNFGYTGLYNDTYCGWWKVNGGAVDFGYNGLYNDTYCGWWKINGGAVDFDYTGLYNDVNCGWWLLADGRVAFEYNGFYDDKDCGWWLVTGGMPDFDYTGFYNDKANGMAQVNGGAVDFNYTGMGDYEGETYYLVDGELTKGWFKNEYTWDRYYFDPETGAMAKGLITIGEDICYFNENSGKGAHDKMLAHGKGYTIFDLKDYCEKDAIESFIYENGVRLGTKESGLYHRPISTAWYWLDAAHEGRVTKCEDIYIENEDGTGKWVYADRDGTLAMGWNIVSVKDEETGEILSGCRRYYDEETLARVHGTVEINGKTHTFDEETGVLLDMETGKPYQVKAEEWEEYYPTYPKYAFSSLGVGYDYLWE